MIGYVTLGTNDIDRAAKFYDALLEPLGGKRFMEMDTFIAWTSDPKTPGLCVTRAFDGKPATVGNGVMVALYAGSPEKVDTLHARALEIGAANEGDPGPRGDDFYAGYFRDPDGNKLNFFCVTRQSK